MTYKPKRTVTPGAGSNRTWNPARNAACVLLAAAGMGCGRVAPYVVAIALATARGATAQSAFPDAEWPTVAGDYANRRFSTLADVNVENAHALRLAWSFATGVQRGHEAAPLVVGGMMYVVTPYPNTLYAFDLSRPPPSLAWTYKAPTDPAAQGVACCDVVNRGVAYADGRVFFNTLDVQTVAVDAASGREVWRRKLGEVSRGETITMAPLVVRDKVLVGNSGGELGVRGWLAALATADGREAWRAYSTGPDRDVLIGPGFTPYYAADRGPELGVSTWPPDAWRIGGGTVWGFVSYDAALDLIYYGTGNPGPWNPAQRPGDNKWTSTLFARRPASGEAVWAYQWSPHDEHDYDGVNENILLELPIAGPSGAAAAGGGAPRPVLVHVERNGYVYVLDRRSGEVLSATPYVAITASAGVDLGTGRLHMVPDKQPRVGVVVRGICPAPPGGKDWQPAAFSPRTGLLYIPHQNLCYDVEGVEVSYIEGTPYVGANVRMYAGPGGQRGVFTAWDPVAARARWRLEERFPVWSGALATAGDVVFYGTMDGWFKAVDARDGRLLWQYETESGVIGQPITYRAPDGRQYVAVLAGVGGWAGAVVAGGLDARDGSAALGFVNAMADLPSATQKGGKLYVFALP
jgi:PQQ-dependent dehydrogenase (methanol/ethanol family)